MTINSISFISHFPTTKSFHDHLQIFFYYNKGEMNYHFWVSTFTKISQQPQVISWPSIKIKFMTALLNFCRTTDYFVWLRLINSFFYNFNQMLCDVLTRQKNEDCHHVQHELWGELLWEDRRLLRNDLLKRYALTLLILHFTNTLCVNIEYQWKDHDIEVIYFIRESTDVPSSVTLQLLDYERTSAICRWEKQNYKWWRSNITLNDTIVFLFFLCEIILLVIFFSIPSFDSFNFHLRVFYNTINPLWYLRSCNIVLLFSMMIRSTLDLISNVIHTQIHEL